MTAVLLIVLLQVPTLRTGADTLEATNIRNGEESVANTQIRAIARVGNTYVITSTSLGSGGTTYDSLAVDARTLKPLWQRTHARTDSASASYDGNRISGFTHAQGAARKPLNRTLADGILPSQLAHHLVQAHDWRTVLVIESYDMWEDKTTRITYRPLRKEIFLHRGQPVDVWVVHEDRGPTDQMRDGGRVLRTLWIDADRGKVLKEHHRPSNAAPGDGHVLVARTRS